MIMVETMVQKLIGLEERCTYLAYVYAVTVRQCI